MSSEKTKKFEENEDRIWMTEAQAAEYLQCSLQNLRNLRYRPRVLKDGICNDRPPVFRFMGNYRYEKHELDKWLLSQKV